MVREFPRYSSSVPEPRSWDQNYSNAFQATVKAQTAGGNESKIGFNNVYPPELIKCRPAAGSHPLALYVGESPLKTPFTLVLLEILLVIVATRIVRFLLKPLRQPRIVSEIIGGIFIGPSILGRSKKFTSVVFPEHSQFIIRNIGIMGFMYFLFISGVKMDFAVVAKTKKKHIVIALVGVFIPLLMTEGVGFILRKSMVDKELAKVSTIGGIASSLALPLFPVIYPILKELNLLSSDIGRLALSIAVLSDGFGITALIVFEAALQGEGRPIAILWYTISLVLILAFTLGVIRKAMHKIIDHTPDGQYVDQAYVVGILLLVMVMGFFTDMFGVAIANGPFWLGLVIPDGPPLGSTLVDRSETMITEILMPFSFAVIGLSTDVEAMIMAGWQWMAPLFAMGITCYASKFIATFATSMFFQVPFRDGVVLSLVMCLKGQVELVLFIHWMDKRMVGIPGFTMLVLLITIVTAIATPLISILYDPTRPYMVHKRRTIQHTPTTDAELRIVLVIYDEDSTAGLINLLEVSNPTISSPFSIFAIRLIELVGRASPVFIDHQKEEDEADLKYAVSQTIHNALKLYQESKGDYVKLFNFTAIAPIRTMYQDICELALLKRATLMILPFHKECLDTLGGKLTEMVRRGIRNVNTNVLAHSPCSVAVLVDKGHLRHPLMAFRGHSDLHFVMLFLGGADAREALCLADRMVGNPKVLLTVIRFLSYNFEGDIEMEKKMDDGVVTWFWVKNERNDRVSYREVVVKNGAETVGAIQALDDHNCDVWIVGRKQGINPVLLEGLSNWSENQELGIIGDFLSSDDFDGTGSVLVVQQQILRGQEAGKGGITGGLNIC
uniref:cation/H(+) antiporter 24 n=1 Tax=Fragaria vesca subsp. vesca TaxID=101020 RepID=UPI0005C96EB4|nr:PREDICTED: cation/H(+) antiporter 24 [Fragaria vesca subsp. vesca]